MESQMMNAALAWMAIAGIWWVLFEAVPSLVIDYTRGRLFDIRHRLFLAAADGQISFDHEGYKKLRSQINVQIRFAHQTSIINLFLLRRALKKNQEMSKLIVSDWNKAQNCGTKEEAELLGRYRSEIGEAVRVRILWADWYLMIPLVFVTFFLSRLSKAALEVREKKFVETAQTQAFAVVENEELVPA